jgi:hypothetical protein
VKLLLGAEPDETSLLIKPMEGTGSFRRTSKFVGRQLGASVIREQSTEALYDADRPTTDVVDVEADESLCTRWVLIS